VKIFNGTRWMRMLALAAAPALVAASARAQTYDAVTMDPMPRDTAAPASIEELAFTSGGERVNGLMYVAQGRGPHPTVILLHGYPGNERNLDLAQATRRAGVNVLFFDYRGSWGSGGTFSFTGAQADVAAAIRFVRSPENARKYRSDPRRVALLGHSMGGWLAMLGAAADTSIACTGALELGDMAQIGVQMNASAAADSEFTQYTRWLTEPGAPLHASAADLVSSLKTNGPRWTVVAHARELAGRTVLLLDNHHNENHAATAAALRQAGARLTADVWRTDHSFSDRRIELARAVVRWLRTGCGYGG
jgi:pimeloyl-ACP methyl ester carboxylesterase